MTSASTRPPHPDHDDDVTPPWVPPGTVRGARIIAVGAAAVGVVILGMAIALSQPYSVGLLVAGYVPTFALVPLVLLFSRRGERLRLATITVALVGAVVSSTGLFTKLPPGLVGVVAHGTIAALLLRPSAKRWFAEAR
ncbi:hypothetical protein BOX37_19065 [Nocardia mangyaensis]|uniref:Uncharacterized protein n=1 Tax=Nocardia mangyaensis TaxID=2213200 RepID=A0A1J0VUK6_9NOCA|nr:hypothetical protein [Nocardia mangyaensis]APE35702.1 hypothetical protein BOX37_19065 [Nocardia mangyaensis]